MVGGAKNGATPGTGVGAPAPSGATGGGGCRCGVNSGPDAAPTLEAADDGATIPLRLTKGDGVRTPPIEDGSVATGAASLPYDAGAEAVERPSGLGLPLRRVAGLRVGCECFEWMHSPENQSLKRSHTLIRKALLLRGGFAAPLSVAAPVF